MNDADIIALAETSWTQGPWWEREAAYAMAAGRFVIIHGRNDRNVYVVRCWTNEPGRDEQGDPESGNSTVLHFFARGDDDAALHDHPWNFRTSILVGGYIEHLPPLDWLDGDRVLGPEWNARTVSHTVGETIVHRAEDLHCVGWVRPGTWSVVRTEKRRRQWGFHAPGQTWLPYRDFLSIRKPELAST